MPTGVYKRRDLAERLWSKVDRSGGPDACWPFLGSRSGKGYGRIYVSREVKQRPAHVVAWELTTGRKIPKGIDGRHHCDNPPCCNPRHVEPGTRKQNMEDARSRGRASTPPHPRGAAHPRAKLTAVQVAHIRRVYQSGHPEWGASALGRLYGVSHTAVSWIIYGKNWGESA